MIRGKSRSILMAGIALALALALASWWAGRSPIPDGLASGNGRIEAEEVDVATRFPGHVDQLFAAEGELVEAGQPLARMDTAEIEAALREAEAQVREAIERSREASATIAQRESECDLAEAEYRRSEILFEQNVEPESRLDVKQSQLRSARAACSAAEAVKLDAEAGIEAAKARVERIQTQLDESLLASPVRGRVLYRLSRVGEVLPAGGKVFTLVDLSDVYMEIFLPSREAARVAIGAEARIVLDGLPDDPIPASVSFVSPEAQFTPRQVETPSERDKLMFRVKVRIPADWVDAHVDTLKTGVRGLAYVRIDGGGSPWPDFLAAQAPTNAR